MTILNLTPDSFAAESRLGSPTAAAEAARRAADEGADALDVGGESTRPGAGRVDAAEQARRVVPAIQAIRRAGIDLPITVDTTLAAVAHAALEAGADGVNDVSGATEDAAMLPLIAQHRCGLVLMHRLAPPGADSYSDRYEREPAYADAGEEVRSWLASRLAAAAEAGVDPRSVAQDPGLGFGKGVTDNLRLIAAAPALAALGRPVVSALSRKSFVGRVSLGRDSDPSERLEGTLALSVLHLAAGARVFRVHDTAAHRRALDAAWEALRAAGPRPADGGAGGA
jgi:dihydropteroate synthase